MLVLAVVVAVVLLAVSGCFSFSHSLPSDASLCSFFLGAFLILIPAYLYRNLIWTSNSVLLMLALIANDSQEVVAYITLSYCFML